MSTPPPSNLPRWVEMYLVARVSTAVAVVAVALSIAAMASGKWSSEKIAFERWEGAVVCSNLGDGSELCLQWLGCDGGNDTACTDGIAPRRHADEGLWKNGADGGAIITARIFSIATLLFAVVLLINRAISGTGEPTKGAFLWLQPPCPMCMAAGFLQALFPFLILILYATGVGGTLEWGFGVQCAAAGCHLLFFVGLVLAHYAVRSDVWWQDRARNACCAWFCCLHRTHEDEETPQGDAATKPF